MMITHTDILLLYRIQLVFKSFNIRNDGLSKVLWRLSILCTDIIHAGYCPLSEVYLRYMTFRDLALFLTSCDCH